MSDPHRVTQTILASDPKRMGNCVAACVASFLGLDLEQVPHFLEFGDAWKPDPDEPDRVVWFAMLAGFMAGHGLWLTQLDDLEGAEPGELVFASGPSPRGVFHQVLYRDGQLWHDPHPSRDGVLEVKEVEAWRPFRHDHAPTEVAS